MRENEDKETIMKVNHLSYIMYGVQDKPNDEYFIINRRII